MIRNISLNSKSSYLQINENEAQQYVFNFVKELMKELELEEEGCRVTMQLSSRFYAIYTENSVKIVRRCGTIVFAEFYCEGDNIINVFNKFNNYKHLYNICCKKITLIELSRELRDSKTNEIRFIINLISLWGNKYPNNKIKEPYGSYITTKNGKIIETDIKSVYKLQTFLMDGLDIEYRDYSYLSESAWFFQNSMNMF